MVRIHISPEFASLQSSHRPRVHIAQAQYFSQLVVRSQPLAYSGALCHYVRLQRRATRRLLAIRVFRGGRRPSLTLRMILVSRALWLRPACLTCCRWRVSVTSSFSFFRKVLATVLAGDNQELAPAKAATRRVLNLRSTQPALFISAPVSIVLAPRTYVHYVQL